jgi:hypothetical protein
MVDKKNLNLAHFVIISNYLTSSNLGAQGEMLSELKQLRSVSIPDLLCSMFWLI